MKYDRLGHCTTDSNQAPSEFVFPFQGSPSVDIAMPQAFPTQPPKTSFEL